MKYLHKLLMAKIYEEFEINQVCVGLTFKDPRLLVSPRDNKLQIASRETTSITCLFCSILYAL